MTPSPQSKDIVIPISCTTCKYTATCRYIDMVQGGVRLCPFTIGAPVKPMPVSEYGGLREARRRIAIYQRMGVHVIFQPYDRQRANTIEDKVIL